MLPNVTQAVLEKVVEFLKLYLQDPLTLIPKVGRDAFVQA